ncbi:hypothetical protein MOUN0_F01992 [Monosporozyma unispora]
MCIGNSISRNLLESYQFPMNRNFVQIATLESFSGIPISSKNYFPTLFLPQII